MSDLPREPPSAMRFTATHWTIVVQAAQDRSPVAVEALEQLCRAYWYPLYAFVRRQGLDPADAQDVTQGFFGCLLEKNYLKDVDRERGRFRSFLLASIKHYLMNERKRARRLKRGGSRIIVSLDQDGAEVRLRSEALLDESPERALDRSWATTVMELAMQRLSAEYEAEGKAPLYRALRRFLSSEAAEGDYDSLAAALEMSKGAVGVAVHRLRKRYGEFIRAEVSNTVEQPLEVDDEMRYLFSVLTGT